MTNYSFSGLVETWKLGATSQINDDVKMRVTWSYDIRQPDIWDLYAPGSNSGNTCVPFVPGGGPNNGQSNNCFNINGGNAQLQPEKSQTIAAGFVFTPSFLDGVTASIDWYQIHIHGALFTPGQTEPITRCQQGDLNYCGLLVFASQGSFLGAQGCGVLNGANNPNRNGCAGADTNSAIIYVHTSPVNAALLSTAGFDFALAYGFDLFTGSADVSFNGNYMYDFSRTLPSLVTPPGGTPTVVDVTYQGAGSNGGYYSGGNRFRGTLNFNYREGAWAFGTQVHLNGDSVMNRGAEGQPSYIIPLQTLSFTKVNGQDVAIPSSGQTYPGWQSTNYNRAQIGFDLRASYKWSNNITLFSAIDNVFDNPTFNNGGSGERRLYRLGVRWNY
jgi:outer membrane receptor protein involved in Fe transport